jgi:FAD/FMN-containing dehydrogenase
MTDPTTTNPDNSKVGAELDEAAVATFKESLRGELMGPDDLAYKDARMIWNRLIDKRPALIARCADANDVVRSVRFVREHELAVAVRGGGHNIAGNCVCDGGLMIDLSQMKGIQVDPERRTARAQPGLTLGEFDRHTQAHGLATTMGIASEVGIAGLTLGGGYGWLAGRYGLACDNLLSVELVTAEGEQLSGLARKSVGGRIQAARGWIGLCSDSWVSSLVSRSFRSVVVNFHLNGRAVWL